MAVGIELTLRTLLGSPNPRATDLLAIALGSSEVALRLGAVRALAIRDDEAGHRRLVDDWPKLPADARAALGDLPPRSSLTATLSKVIRDGTPKQVRRASEIAATLNIVDALPAIVEAASRPRMEGAAILAADAYQLACRLTEAVDLYDPLAKVDGGQHQPDPAFARRPAVNALVTALETYGDHRQLDLLQALLLLTPGDEPALLRALGDEGHSAHEALLKAIRTSRCRGVIEVLASALVDLRSPQPLLEIAAERCDREGLEALLAHLTYPIGLRIRENCRRVASFAWLEESRRGVICELPGPLQATAVQLAAASQADPRDIAGVIELVLDSDDAPARLAACRAIEALPQRAAVEPIRRALDADDPAVVAFAVKMVRAKNYPGATALLVGMLNNPDAKVRSAAGKSLRELSFATFRDSYAELPESSRSVVGKLVGKADPMAAPSLRAELGSGAVARRLRALELIGLMGLADNLAEELIACVTDDKDLGVRVEAAGLLGELTLRDEAVEALVEATGARSTALRATAEKSLQRLTGQTLAELTGSRS
ncbi:HEAT repeat domain-containing protein [Botrimarina mediterranea]|uniref:HEAT repeat domain-containing protein n=1 Tax=Botrimarina mediterranea TaxID=2528022 RepID=UPI00118C277C|nr:hypothetical protein K2D_17960 [Planctomycetes bacterium K2D]